MSKSNTIKLWWHKNEGVPNFGDLIGPYLVSKISGREIKYTPIKRFTWQKVYVTVGSILAAVNHNCIIWGSGIAFRNENVQKAKFLAVRGPYTQSRLFELGFNPGKILGDPALLLPSYYDTEVDRIYDLGIIPHYVDYSKIVGHFSISKKINVIDLVNEDIQVVIDEIRKCRYVISSSLHGLIVSHAYRIPALWGRFSDDLYGDDIKFDDYRSSIGLNNYKPLSKEDVSNNIEKLTNWIQVHPDNLPRIEHFDKICQGLIEICPFKQ